ncbi:MAG: Do family serine endopeptidase [Candidatus Latescibacteria bacterium]|nr:Do family serine endopeptidase [Candidatus Latescibacterota bacterium]
MSIQTIRFRQLTLFAGLLIAAGAFTTPAFATEDQAMEQLRNLNKAFTSIARRVTPTVVTISTRETVRSNALRGQIPEDYRRFFRMPRGERRERPGLGSGIIMSADGYVLTNHHVAGSADEITVILNDNQEFEARLVGTDSLTDVAVIKIDAEGLASAPVGNSDEIQIGEWVMAVGAPLDLRSTVTSGIISALGRNLNIISDRSGFAIEDFIQTDAAINPGNSGGALINLDGEVIGVNTAIASGTGGFVGYGFAIPINLARKVMDDIITHGRVRRGFLGINLRRVDASLADAFGLDGPRGVLIANVFSDTPADAAGLKDEDIILSIDGTAVNRPNQVQSLIARKHPDETVALEIRRKNRTITHQVKLGEKPAQIGDVASTRTQAGQTELHGLSVSNITPEVESRWRLEAGMDGILVTEVAQGSRAARARFQRGDIIFKVRQGNLEREVRTVEDFKASLAKLEKGRNAAFFVRRGTYHLFLTMKISE